MKKLLAVLCLLLLFIFSCAIGAFAAFDDTAASPYHEAIHSLSDIGLVVGVSENRFGTEQNVTRQQMALFIARLKSGLNITGFEESENTTRFADLTDKTYYKAVSYCYNLKIVAGRTEDAFDPTGNVTVQEAIAMALRALGYTDLAYPDGYIRKAIDFGLTEKLEDADYHANMTRGQTAQLLYNTLHNSHLLFENGQSFYDIWFADKENLFYHNYIEVFDLDGKLYRIGDPFVMRYDGYYYLYSSITSGHINGDIYVWKSENLVDWKCAGICATSSGEDGNTYTAYAPEVVYYNGSFWLCESQNGQGHYIFKSDSPTGPFTAVSGNLGKGIDGSFYLDDSGELYFLYALGGDGAPYIRYNKINVEGKTDAQIIQKGSGQTLKAHLNGWTEGPGYFRRGDFFYLTYTGNHVRDKSYRIGYSCTNSDSLLKGLFQPKYNSTLLSTDTPYPAGAGYGSGRNFDRLVNFTGLGHSSNTIGPNLDSIYTAFHNEEKGTFNRRLNITQYFTNGTIVTANGLGITDIRKPKMPDYALRDVSLLETDGAFKLSAEATQEVYTAEINFKIPDAKRAKAVVSYKDSSDCTEILIDGNTLSLIRVSDGKRVLLGRADISKGVSLAALCTLRVVAGADTCEIYLNNMRKLELDIKLGGGKIGVGDGAVVSSMFFSNDAFGTGDFEAVKNLPSTFPAYTYLKGENRGFSIADAKVMKNGVRQGEKESTKNLGLSYATVLSAGDFVTYAVNAPSNAAYALDLALLKESAGAVIVLTVDENERFEFTLPAVISGKSGVHNIRAGKFSLEKGEHRIKLSVEKGTLSLTQITVETAADTADVSSDAADLSSFMQQKSGTGRAVSTGFRLDGSILKTMYTLKNSESASGFSFSASLQADSAESLGGLVFRMSDYNFNTKGGSDYCFNGYYLQINKGEVILYKYYWNGADVLKRAVPLDNAGVDSALELTVEAYCGSIKVYADGKLMIEVYDAESFVAGACGFYVENGAFTVRAVELKNN